MLDARYGDGTYLAANPTWDAEDSPWKAGQVRGILERNGVQPTTIAEVGCGAGGILAVLADNYKRSVLRGFDIAPEAIRMAQRHHGERLSFHLDDPLRNNDRFDVLLALDVFEHVPDYLGFLRRCKEKALYKVFHIPLDMHVSAILRDVHMRQRERVGHLHYFTASSALAALRDTGHEIVDHCYTCGAIDLFWTHPSIKRAAANLPRWLVGRLNVDLSAKLLGGYSLLVLCR